VTNIMMWSWYHSFLSNRRDRRKQINQKLRYSAEKDPKSPFNALDKLPRHVDDLLLELLAL
jgi:hypothetical protein